MYSCILLWVELYFMSQKELEVYCILTEYDIPPHAHHKN